MKIIRIALIGSLVIGSSCFGVDIEEVQDSSASSGALSSSVIVQPTSANADMSVAAKQVVLPHAKSQDTDTLKLPKWDRDEIRYQVLREDLDKILNAVRHSHAITNGHVAEVKRVLEQYALFLEALVKQNAISMRQTEAHEKEIQELKKKMQSILSVTPEGQKSSFFASLYSPSISSYLKGGAAVAACSFLMYKLYRHYNAAEEIQEI